MYSKCNQPFIHNLSLIESGWINDLCNLLTGNCRIFHIESLFIAEIEMTKCNKTPATGHLIQGSKSFKVQLNILLNASSRQNDVDAIKADVFHRNVWLDVHIMRLKDSSSLHMKYHSW